MAETSRTRQNEEPGGEQRLAPFAALRHRDFRLYWSGSLVSVTGTQMQQAAIAWQIYVLSHSAAALGLMGLFRVIPIIALSLGGGVIADAIDRRRLLLGTQMIFLMLSAVLAALTYSGAVRLWMIYVMTALAAGTVAFDNPARQALVPSLVTRGRLTNALSLSSTSFQLAMIIGPSLAGVIIAGAGIGTVYALDAVSYIAALTTLYGIRPPAIEGMIQRPSMSAAIEGLRFIRDTPIIMYLMGLDFVATFFASATALLPIFARDILRVGAQGYGLLYAAPAAGAVLAGICLTFYAPRIRSQGLVILISIGFYAGFTILFGASRLFVLSLLALAAIGASDTISTILRQTVRQSATPDALRGRMVSVNMIFFMGGPQLGELEAGLVARASGAPFSVISGGCGALLAVVLAAAGASTLRGYRDGRQ